MPSPDNLTSPFGFSRIFGNTAEVSRLSAELDRLRATREALRVVRKATARKIPLREADDRDKVKLSCECKLFTDTVNLADEEIVTRLDEMLVTSFHKCQMEGRRIIRALLSTSGDLRVTGTRCNRCVSLSTPSATLPETPYVPRFQVKPRPIREQLRPFQQRDIRFSE